MPSVFTIEGTGADTDFGEDLGTSKCKIVTNKRTKCRVKLCHTGKGRTGWTFMKGSTVCDRKGK